jgi:hypothetical protein
MVAFVPISPAAARQLLDGIGEVDSGVLLGDFVEHGLIKAYARVVETLSTGGGRQEVRDARIPAAIWKRIVLRTSYQTSGRQAAFDSRAMDSSADVRR